MLKRIILRFRDLFLSPQEVKETRERECWKRAYQRSSGQFNNEYYQYFYTQAFGLDETFYESKKVLDIGCGPRGSLEWGGMMMQRIGLDPLADSYKEFGTESHAMEYVNAYCEEIPFEDSTFDVVTSMNSLDHVDDLTQSIGEIRRVMRPGGSLILLTDIHEHPTRLEPQAFSWDVVERFADYKCLLLKQLEKINPSNVYDSVKQGIEFDFSNNESRYGVLLAHFQKGVLDNDPI